MNTEILIIEGDSERTANHTGREINIKHLLLRFFLM